MYPVLAVGLLLLARVTECPAATTPSLLDGLIITLGVGLLSWIFLIGPNVRAPGGLLVRFTAAAYPLGDILLLAMLAHLWSAGGLRNTAGRFWPSARWGRSWPTRSTAWPACTRVGTGTTVTPSTSAGSSSTAAGARLPSTRR